MTSLITNYSDQPPAALKNSEVYKVLESIINAVYDEECFNIRHNNTFVQLKSLIGDELTESAAVKILQPWVNAVRIAAVVKKIKTKMVKQKHRRQFQHVDAIIRNLKKGISPDEPLIFFLKGDEFNRQQMIECLDTYKQHYSLLLNLKLPNGAPLNPHNIRKHGIFSLFHLGSRLKLKKSGQPSPLHQFIHIATGKEYEDIEKYYLQYNRKKFEIITMSNPVFSFIYNPKTPMQIKS